MKAFRIDYEYDSGGQQASIVLADDIDSAKVEAGELIAGRICVDDATDDKYDDKSVYSISEIEQKAGVVYTGYFCC